MTTRSSGARRSNGGHTSGVRALAILLAVLVPTAHALAAMHLHCALEHPLGRATAHAAGEHAHPHADHGAAHYGDPADAQPGGGRSDGSQHSGHALVVSPFHEHHHHADDATEVNIHGGCCIALAAGAMPAAEYFAGVDERTDSFDPPAPSGAYDSPCHEPPPRPQWRAHARV